MTPREVRVKVADVLVEKLGTEWSEPVRITLDRREADGDWILSFKTEEDWRGRAVKHASALSSILAARGVERGTFGEQWRDEAHETLRRDLEHPA